MAQTNTPKTKGAPTDKAKSAATKKTKQTAVDKIKSKIEKSRPVKAAKPKQRANRAKLLVSIVNRKDDVKLKEVLDEFSIALSFKFEGRGTAQSAVLDYLGIGETEKTVVVSLFPESDEAAILREIRTQMSLYLVGRGISFTIPLSAVSQITANGLTGAATNKTVDGSKIMTDKDRKFDLIMAVIDSGYTDTAMEAARAAGAAGGTIIRARSLNNKKAEQFIGISLADEKEILLILAKREVKQDIMQALSVRVGLKSEANGVIFALPVDRTAGIGAADEAETATASDKGDKSDKTEKSEKADKEKAEPTEAKEAEKEESKTENE